MPQQYADVFGESRYYITNEHMKAFRSRLFSDARKKDTEQYHPDDTRRIMENDEYCWRFIVHTKLDLERAVRMANTALKWRQEMKVDEISELTLPKVYFQLGFIYPFNLDKYGNHVLIFCVKEYFRSSLNLIDAKKFIVFFVEKLFRDQNANRITLIFDCNGAENRNVDIRLMRFLVSLFRTYYPRSMGFILLWEVPWVLNALWKMLKGLLPIEAIERVRFVSRDSITKFIDREKLPIRMGGLDDYIYVYKAGYPLGDRCQRLSPHNPSSSPTRTLNVYGLFTA